MCDEVFGTSESLVFALKFEDPCFRFCVVDLLSDWNKECSFDFCIYVFWFEMKAFVCGEEQGFVC